MKRKWSIVSADEQKEHLSSGRILIFFRYRFRYKSVDHPEEEGLKFGVPHCLVRGLVDGCPVVLHIFVVHREHLVPFCLGGNCGLQILDNDIIYEF